MRIVRLFALLLSFLSITSSAFTQNKKQKNYIPWSNGELLVSEEGRYLKHRNGTPFFWLGDTGWLLPERLNRDENTIWINANVADITWYKYKP